MTHSILILKQVKIVAFLIMSYTISFNGNCYAQEWVPADFKDTAQSILRRIDYSKRGLEGLVVINGGSKIARSGRLEGISIYSNPSQNSKFGFYERAVENALEERLFEPAKIDGTIKPVWANFSVVFETTGEETTVRVFDSLLAHADVYGTEYTDPQRELIRRFPAACVGITGSMVWVAVDIDAEAKPSNPEIIAGRVTPQCGRAVIREMNKSKYIPAILNGEPVKAKYVEVFYTPDRMRWTTNK